MIPLARGVAILYDFTGRTQLETDGISVLLTAIGTAQPSHEHVLGAIVV
jgi:hypothetical protein